MLDSRQSIETPEGVELTLAVAGPVPRALAFGVDLVIRLGILGALFGVLVGVGELGMGVGLIAAFALEWLYPVVCELRWGATPGKKLYKLEVVHADGSPVSLGTSLLRNLLRAADFMPLCYLFGYVCCLFTQRFQRLGDLAAGTVVVHRAEPKRVPLLRRASDSPLPPPLLLTAPEQRALISFAERAPGWTAERRAELAGLTGTIATGSPQERSHQLVRIARWIAGER